METAYTDSGGRIAGATGEELLDVMFTTTKELRHHAEQILSRLFVRTEVIAVNENMAEFVLRAGGMQTIRVLAQRERPWHPYRITRVDPGY